MSHGQEKRGQTEKEKGQEKREIVVVDLRQIITSNTNPFSRDVSLGYRSVVYYFKSILKDWCTCILSPTELPLQKATSWHKHYQHFRYWNNRVFKRFVAVFPRDAIAKYVAHCLTEEHHRPVSQGDPIVAATESRQQPEPYTKPLREPVLKEVVAPGQVENITILVSTLAKAYAQRLVTATAASTYSNSQFSAPNKISPRKAASTQDTAKTDKDVEDMKDDTVPMDIFSPSGAS